MKYIKFLFIALVVNTALFAETAESNQGRVLSGLIIRHGDIVDSIRPIYGEIDANGKVEDLAFGSAQVGGNGGTEKIVLKQGYVIVGFYMDKGNYFGAMHIGKLRIIWQKWSRNKPEGDLILSDSYSTGSHMADSVKIELSAPKGSFIRALNASATQHTNGDNFLSEIQIEVASESSKKSYIGTAANTNTPSISYSLEVEIISGFNKGKIAKGSFSFNTFGIKGEGEEFLDVSEIEFTYDNDKYTRDSFDAVPKIRLIDGKFKEIQFTGGPQTKRFGINSGFNRNQFGRDSEIFILKGEDYFGYLNAETYVEGAGKVKYKKVK
jgi:hypothetical protein